MGAGYVADVLDEARIYSQHANKKSIDAEDVKLAVQCKLDHSFTNPPPRDVSYTPEPFLHQPSTPRCELYSLTIPSSTLHRAM